MISKTTVSANVHLGQDADFNIRLGKGDFRPPYAVLAIGNNCDVFLEMEHVGVLAEVLRDFLGEIRARDEATGTTN